MLEAPPDWQLFMGDGPNGLVAYGPVDHTFYDPPYDQDVDVGNAANEVRDNPFGFDPMSEDLRNRTARAVALQTRRWALVFCSVEEAHLWRFALIAAGMSYYRTGFWIRLNTQPQQNGLGPAQGVEAIVIAHSRVLTQRWNGGGKPATWYAPIVRTDRIHPTQKPCSLMRELIEDFTDEGEIIADPFSGAGTTGVAAVGLGRRFVGWEMDEGHYQAARKRLELPLLEQSKRHAEQMTLAGRKPKGAAARARMELDRNVLDTVNAIGPEGVQSSKLAEILQGSEHEIRRSLNRLRKAGQIVRKGTTSSTRWYANEMQSEDHGR